MAPTQRPSWTPSSPSLRVTTCHPAPRARVERTWSWRPGPAEHCEYQGCSGPGGVGHRTPGVRLVTTNRNDLDIPPRGERSDDEERTSRRAGPPRLADVAGDLAVVGQPDLRAALAGLSLLAADQVELPDMLRNVAQFAVQAIPGADGAGLTLIRSGTPVTVVVTTDFVQRVDDIQYTLDEGPCITAVAEQIPVRSGSLGAEPRWPRFGRRVAALDVHSALAVPLATPQDLGAEVVGALNIYGRPREAFDESAERLAELYAVPAAVSVHTARALTDARTLADHLQNALDSHAVIDQAIGILMSRTGATPTEAFTRLRAISQKDNVRLRIVAQRLVEQAVRRARAPKN